jgi:hypothetical protein
MRLIKVNAPHGRGTQIAETAFSVGIDKVSIYQSESRKSGGQIEIKDTIDIETSTPKGKRFIDALLQKDFYDTEQFSIVVRQPRSIISKESFRQITKPLVEPASDIAEELWQFSHITYGFVGRTFIAACLIAYGLIQHQILLIIAGLLFLPLLPLLLSTGFGGWTGQWKLSIQGIKAFITAIILLVLGGAAVGLFNEPPIKYTEFSPLHVSFLISLAVGIAAGLANIDDVGRREMIGLAATAQIAIIPVWFGLCAIMGFPTTASESDIINRASAFFLNTLTIIASSLGVYVLSGAVSRSLRKVKD